VVSVVSEEWLIAKVPGAGLSPEHDVGVKALVEQWVLIADGPKLEVVLILHEGPWRILWEHLDPELLVVFQGGC